MHATCFKSREGNEKEHKGRSGSKVDSSRRITANRAEGCFTLEMAVNEFGCVGKKAVNPFLMYYCLNCLEKMRTTKNFSVYRRTPDPDLMLRTVRNRTPNSQHCDVR